MKEKELKQLKSQCETIYSTHGACPNHNGITFEELEPRQFSFNSPFGACAECHGLGAKMEIDPNLIIPDKNLSIIDGAIKIYSRMDKTWRIQQLKVVGDVLGFDTFTPIKQFTNKQLNALLHGDTTPIKGQWRTGVSMNMDNGFEGIIPQTKRLYKQTESEFRKTKIEKFMIMKPCNTCYGKRLKENILSVKIQNKSIINITDMNITNSLKFFKELEKKLNKKEKFIAKQILKEINQRLSFLNNVGLNYLNLSRSAGTLSGGEAQRIRLATQIGANLMGVLYVLDEPSIGLHQKDNAKLISTLYQLRDIGNTLIVVEHDEDTIKEADWVIDIGPGAGIHGGKITAMGTPEDIIKNKNSITGDYLSGRKKIEVPKTRRKVNM